MGASPRASQALLRTSQAYAAINGRDYVLPDDVKAMVKPVLAHRLITRHSGSENGSPIAFRIIDDIVNNIPVPSENELSELEAED